MHCLLRLGSLERFISSNINISVLGAVDIETPKGIWRVSKLYSSIIANNAFNLVNPMAQLNIIYVYNWFRLSSVWTNVSFVSSGSVRARTLALLWFGFCVLLWLQIVYIADPQANPSHSDYGILLKLEAFCLVRIFGIFTDYVP
jgi:hypothetical protein